MIIPYLSLDVKREVVQNLNLQEITISVIMNDDERHSIMVDWDWVYIWSQIFTVVEYGLLGLSYLAKKRRMVVILDIFSMLSGIVAFILLGADLGMAMSVIILVANFYYLWDEKRRGSHQARQKLFLSDYIVLALVLIGIGVVTWLTYDGPLSLLSVAATTIYEISIWQKSTKVYKILGVPVAFCWMTYNGFVHSIFGVLCELVMFVASIAGVWHEVQDEKKAAARRKRRQNRAKMAKKKSKK